MKKTARCILVLLLALILTQTVFNTALAHPGRVDSNGGHRDNRNASGLGSYHYHCGGYPAHLHPNGVCPYAHGPAQTPPQSSSTPSQPVTPRSLPPATTAETNISVFVNGNKLDLDIGPSTYEGRTLVPMRPIFEALGYSVGFNSDTQEITASKDDSTIQMRVNSNQATVNGEVIRLEIAAQSQNGRTLVPLRFVAEASGSIVNWDAEAQCVYVVTQ